MSHTPLEAIMRILSPEVLAMLNDLPNSQCAIDCMRAIAATVAFIEANPDLLHPNKMQVYAMAARQCEVFYFG